MVALLPLLLERGTPVLGLVKPVHREVEQDRPLDDLRDRPVEFRRDGDDDARAFQVVLVLCPSVALWLDGAERVLAGRVVSREEVLLCGGLLGGG